MYTYTASLKCIHLWGGGQKAIHSVLYSSGGRKEGKFLVKGHHGKPLHLQKLPGRD